MPDGENVDQAEQMKRKAERILPGKQLSKGDEGGDVSALHSYLTRFGYFPNPDLHENNKLFRPAVPFPPEDDSKFDDRTESALRKFQMLQGLEVTGKLDEPTLELMGKPRCGVPDIPVSDADGNASKFVAQGNRWNTNNLSYRFDNFSPDLTQNEQRAALRGAFDRWSAVTPLGFTENPNTGDIRIGWYSGDHGDGASNAFDGVSGTLAHCFYPPPNGGDIAGDCHFDEAETWSVNLPPSGIDLPSVALHELGHGLGLDHSEDTNAVMYAYYGGPRRELTDDDIAGIRSIYGARFRWGSLGGIVFEPATALNTDGRLEVFVRGADNAVWNNWQTRPSAGPWSGWHSLGGGIQGAPAAARNSDGRLELFARGMDGQLFNNWQPAPSSGPWSGWHPLGGHIFDPVACRNADGRLEVFARGQDGALWHIWQTRPSSGPWSGWHSLGGVMGSRVSAITNTDGRMEVFVRGTNGALFNIWQTRPSSGPWSGWNSLGGGIQGAPVAGRNADGRLEVFAKGMDNALWHMWQTRPSSGPWSGWASLGGGISNPSVANNADGRLEVFVKGLDNGLWHIWQTARSNGWSGWASLGGGFSEGPVATRNGDGRLEVFVKGLDSGLWNTWQSAPNNGWN